MFFSYINNFITILFYCSAEISLQFICKTKHYQAYVLYINLVALYRKLKTIYLKLKLSLKVKYSISY